MKNPRVEPKPFSGVGPDQILSGGSPAPEKGFFVPEIDILEDLREPDHYGRIPESLIYDKKAPHTAIRLYGVFDRHLNKKTKACLPGYNRIRELTGMSKTTISKAMAYLEKANYIKVLRDPHKSNHYQLMDLKLVQKMDKGSPEIGQHLVQKMDSNHRSLTRAINHRA